MFTQLLINADIVYYCLRTGNSYPNIVIDGKFWGVSRIKKNIYRGPAVRGRLRTADTECRTLQYNATGRNE